MMTMMNGLKINGTVVIVYEDVVMVMWDNGVSSIIGEDLMTELITEKIRDAS